MEEHLRILFAIVNLLVGAGSFVYVNNLKNIGNTSIIKYLKLYIVAFNLIILAYFLIKYLNVNLVSDAGKTDSAFRDSLHCCLLSL